ncbi:MAG TPA: S8 family serine peptidase, partial [Candidatus Acidoferrales bacterium]|nr:S8 family serine peptidase [Candidatus Acidoferrales bacterium]
DLSGPVLRIALPALLSTALAACSGGSAGLPLSSAGPLRLFVGQHVVGHSCGEPRDIPSGQAVCESFELADLRSNDAAYGYGPAELVSAYRVPTARGSGALVAIVIAYGYRSVDRDLAQYRSHFKLPACTTSDGCLKIVGQTGGPPPAELKVPKTHSLQWQMEGQLDLDMVSAICPKCRILLVEAQSPSNSSLYAAESTANRLGAVVISNSWGSSPETEASNAHFSGPGSTYVAGAGDWGGGLADYIDPSLPGGPAQPCTFSNVVCVGGTTLKKDSSARGWSEVVWNEEDLSTGSACSLLVKKPAWQTDKGCRMRSGADLSAVAGAPNGVASYYSQDGSNPNAWLSFDGTSVATPIIAAMIALAGNGATDNIPKSIWMHGQTGDLFDVTRGTNISKNTGPCASKVSYICVAGPGYDGPTGWGTPNGIGAL